GSVFSSRLKAQMLLRSKRAYTFLEELKPASMERECIEERCDFEEAREIYQTREATVDGDQCVPNPCINGVCVDQIQSYYCSCNPGFEGKHCHIDSTHANCSVDNGGCDHNCHERKDSTGRYCSCTDGYTLHEDYKQCVPKSQHSCGQILIAKSAYNTYNTKSFEGLQPWLFGAEGPIPFWRNSSLHHWSENVWKSGATSRRPKRSIRPERQRVKVPECNATSQCSNTKFQKRQKDKISLIRTKPIEGLQPWLVGGEVGKRGESPWQVSCFLGNVLLQYTKWKFHCGGVLIDDLWVLTAAHCLEGFSRFGVRLGDYKRFEFEGSEVTLAVVQSVAHPNYNSQKADNDIAMLRLVSPAPFSKYIVPACLPSKDLAERVLHLNGTMTVVTGWGTDKQGSIPHSSDLKHINVPLVKHSECRRHMSNNLTENVMCAGSIGSIKDACSGDSGGPMMTLYRNTWFLIGLVSWGEGCGHTDKLGIYTKVSNYLDWI
ncbi:vitamin K-dependent protein C precursor, partial [Silurus asotus]